MAHDRRTVPPRTRGALAILIVTLAVLVPSHTAAIDIEATAGLAPRLNGTFDARVGAVLGYTASLYTAVSADYGADQTETIAKSGVLATTNASRTESLSLDLDILGYNLIDGPLNVGIAASVEYLQFAADERILYDADDGYAIPATGTNTLELTNNRRLNVILPTVDARARLSAPFGWIDLGAEYSPAVTVLLDQRANTDPAYPNFTDNGPVATSGTYQSGQSFSVSGELVLRTSALSPAVRAEYTHLPIRYEIATVGGVQPIDSLIRELAIESEVGIGLIEILGFSPTVRVRYDRAWTEIAGSADVSLADEWLLYVGARRY